MHWTDNYPKLFTEKTFRLDNTGLEVITTCLRRAEYYLVRKRESTEGKGALNFGAGIHEGLAIRYLDGMPLATPQNTENQLAKTAKFFEENPQPLDDEFRTAPFALDVIEEYNAHYNAEMFDVVEFSGTKCVEFPFILPLGKIDDVTILWTGKIDVLIELEKNLWVMDHKTTSILGPYYFKQFENAGQFKGYCWAVEQLIGRKPRGVLINALAIRKPTKTGKPIEFQRQRINYSPNQINEWQNNTLSIISNFFHAIQTTSFPMHTPWCYGKFGACEYLEVCTCQPQQRDILLNSRAFRDVTWDPLN